MKNFTADKDGWWYIAFTFPADSQKVIINTPNQYHSFWIPEDITKNRVVHKIQLYKGDQVSIERLVNDELIESALEFEIEFAHVDFSKMDICLLRSLFPGP